MKIRPQDSELKFHRLSNWQPM